MPGKNYILLFCLLWSYALTQGQTTLSSSFFERSDTFNSKRFIPLLVTGATIYTGTVIALNATWYQEYERSSFHLFNDWGEWEHMDKLGHSFTAYMESEWIYLGARWTGMKKNPSIWTAMGLAMIFQTTLEVMDAHSEKWGFSIPDMVFNTAGAGLFGVQQGIWDEQRLRIKVSSFPKSYPSDFLYIQSGEPINLDQRTEALFGNSLSEKLLKDYNAQTIWLSGNVSSFTQEDRGIPKWLNIAIGYGAENMFGGFENSWTFSDGEYTLPNETFPRYRQFYLSPDIDLSRIKTESGFLKFLFSMLNTIKIPAPAIELNTNGNLVWHWIHF